MVGSESSRSVSAFAWHCVSYEWLIPPSQGSQTTLTLICLPVMTPQPSNNIKSQALLNTLDVTVICFSKDRAFQLKEYLRTLLTYVTGPKLSVHVIWKASTTKFRESYQKLAEMFGTKVEFIEETDFVGQLKDLVKKAHDFILWGVDDVFYYNTISLAPFMDVMNRDATILCGHLRLSPNVTYCHPSDSNSVVPPFSKVATSGSGTTSSTLPLLRYTFVYITQQN